MDVLDEVRGLAPAEQPYDRQLAVARSLLAREIEAAGARPSTPRRATIREASGRARWRWVGGVTAAAAVVATGIVVAGNLIPVDPTGPGVPPVLVPPAATAAELLEQTADRVGGVGAAPAAGQYLRIDETDAFTEYAIEDAATGELVTMGNRGNAIAAFVTQRTTHLYVPADRDDEWVWDQREPWSVTRSFGERADEAITTWKTQQHTDTPPLWRLPGGRAPHSSEAPDATLDERELFDEMPRDPAALLSWLRARTGASGAEADRQVVWTLGNSLTTNLAPAVLRTAMFRALALVDGIRIDHRGDQTSTLAFTVPGDGWTRTTTFTIDDAKALVTAVSDSSVPAGGSIVPADLPDEQRTVSVTIVDRAP